MGLDNSIASELKMPTAGLLGRMFYRINRSLPILSKGKAGETLFHESAIKCVDLFKSDLAPAIHKLCIFDAGDDGLVNYFGSSFRIKPFGFEPDREKHGRISSYYQQRIQHTGFFDFFSVLNDKHAFFDLLFAPSLARIPKKKIQEALALCRQRSAFLYFDNSEHKYRALGGQSWIREPIEWWDQQFGLAGFEECANMWGGRTYLWRPKIK